MADKLMKTIKLEGSEDRYFFAPDWENVQNKPENFGGILDVTELPTENIDESLLYRLVTPVCTFGKSIDEMYIMHAVETLPESDILSIEMVGENDIIVHAYYVTSDESVSAYINDIGSTLLGGIPVGWYSIEVLAQANGSTYGGIIHSLDEATEDTTYYVMVTYELYSYKNEWTSLKVIGRSGIGIDAEAFNDDSNTASGDYSHAEGQETTAEGECSHAEGYGTNASGYYSHAEGDGTIASGHRSHAEGQSTTASGYASHAEGQSTTAASSSSHAEGYGTNASEYHSHAEGHSTTASGYSSHAEGSKATASGYVSHAEGWETTAEGYYSHAEGYKAIAKGESAHAEGYETNASSNRSHAEGSNTTASGSCAHAEGYNTTADSESAHAEGEYTTAYGEASHAEGTGTRTTGKSQHVQGEYNVLDVYNGSGARAKYAHIVGNGTSDARSNAHTLDWDGNAWFAGDVYVGSTSGTNKDEGSKKLVTSGELAELIGGGVNMITITTSDESSMEQLETDDNDLMLFKVTGAVMSHTFDEIANIASSGVMPVVYFGSTFMLPSGINFISLSQDVSGGGHMHIFHSMLNEGYIDSPYYYEIHITSNNTIYLYIRGNGMASKSYVDEAIEAAMLVDETEVV